MKNILFVALVLAFSFFAFSSSAHAGTIGKPPYLLTLTSGLVGHWTFDGKDMPGGRANDLSGNGNHGNPASIATSTFYVSGKVGQAVNFDGVDDQVALPNNAFDSHQEGTISAWIKLSSKKSSGFGVIFGQGNTTNANRNFNIGIWAVSASDSRLAVYSSSPSPDEGLYGNTSLALDTWYHVAVVSNGSAWTLYLNGVSQSLTLIAGGNFGSWIGDNADGNTDLYKIGAIQTTGAAASFFHGPIDDVRIYNRALSAIEITQLYNFGAAKQNVTATRDHLRSGLVGHWTFDGKDMIGGVARDVSGNGYTTNLISIASSTFYTGGKIGQGVMFDGVNDIVFLSGSAPLLDNMPAFSVSFWLQPKVLAISQAIVSKADNASGGHGWAISTDGAVSSRLNFNVFGFGPDLTVISGSNALVAGELAHYTVTWDGSTTATNVHMYKNGVELSYVTQTNGAVLNTDESRPVLIGRDSGWGSGFLSGMLDDVRIYNRVLSAAEIKQLANVGVAKQNVSVSPEGLKSGLVGHWTFDGKDMIGGRALDVSGQGNHGSLTNIATSTFYVGGKMGQGLKFDGVNDNVSVLDNTVLDGFSQFTVSLWGNQDVVVEGGGLVNKFVDTSGNRSYDVYSSGTNEISVFVSSNGSTRELDVSVNDCGFTSNNTWTHILVTYNAGTINYYKNGIVCDTDANAITSIFNSPSQVMFGLNNDLAYFNGSLDDVRIYNRALSATEITQLYNLGK